MPSIKIKQKPGQKPQLPLGADAFIIGNGTSRKGLDLTQLKGHGIIYGCNWFYRKEFKPDVLITSDEPITNTITKVDSWYPRTNWFFTWYPKPGSGAKKAPTPEKFAAGPMATYTAVKSFNSKKVFLIGMDFFGFGSSDKNNNGGLNNLYANEKHYQKVEEGSEGHAPTYRNWQRRFEWIMVNCPDVDFYHVNPFEGKSPERLKGLPNFHQITWDNLIEYSKNDSPLIDILVKSEEDIALTHTVNEDNVRACIERQLVGQENVIYSDLLSPQDVLNLRLHSIEHSKKHKTTKPAVVQIGPFDIMLPMFHMIDETGAIHFPSSDKVIADYKKEIVVREEKKKGYTQIRLKLPKVQQSDLPPPPPPPSFDDLLPPPPPSM